MTSCHFQKVRFAMCSETFLRLPAEKRDRFLEAAWEEFMTAPYPQASINQIIRRANIPRGSFYQYFPNKDSLFSYLMETVFNHFVSEYRRFVIQADGNLFETQILCFDRFVLSGASSDLLFRRCIQILKLNPEILPQLVMSGRLVNCMFRGVRDLLDTDALRSHDPDFLRHTFTLVLVALAFSIMDTLAAPELAPQHRQSLLAQLDIIRQGCLAPSVRHIDKEVSS